MNLIDKDKLIEAFEDLISHTPENKKEYYAYTVLKELIKREPPVNQWISVEEHRPTEPSLLQFEDGSMAVGFYDSNWECWRTRVSGEDYVILHKEGKKPIVWQPLPPKYEG